MHQHVASSTRPARSDQPLDHTGGLHELHQLVFLGVAAAGLVVGGLLAITGATDAADVTWAVVTSIGLLHAGWWLAAGIHQRRIGVDAIAVLSLAGALAVGELLAGAVITLMLATGRALEGFAAGRARRDLTALASHVPTLAHLRRGDSLEEVAVADIGPGDLVVVASGEVVPVDGTLVTETALVDESLLTGEPMPVEHVGGDLIRSGTLNAAEPIELRATATAEGSTYAGVVRLVAQASAGTAPLARLADRFAGAFVLGTLALAGAAWAASGDPVRAVAVLVVATPCPLLLAVPVAIVAGLSRAAKRGVIVKGGGALEQLARAKVLLLDKTGTLTSGHPVVRDVVSEADLPPDEVLRLAASVDQLSAHVLAAAVVRAAQGRGLPLTMPSDVQEMAGQGVRGIVGGHEISVGKASWISTGGEGSWVADLRRRAAVDGSLTVFVGRDGAVIGALLLDDPLRLDARSTLRALRRRGLRRIVMVTGDRSEVGEAIGVAVGVDDVYAERSPGDKVDVVRLEATNGATVMVGDGLNDAAALAAADVGVALGARGATVASEAADVVITLDRLDRLEDALGIAHRAFGIARQSVVVGMTLAGVAMLVAAAGLLPPAWGAACQELIDVAVIANALRALRGGVAPSAQPAEVALTERFSAEHRTLATVLVDLRSAADALASGDRQTGLALARAAHAFLVEELLPHEWAEDRTLYPLLDQSLGGPEATAVLSREHVEIAHLVRRLGRLLDLAASQATDADAVELCGVLYGLLAILRLHFAQEDERYYRRIGDQTEARSSASSASSATKPRSVRVRG